MSKRSYVLFGKVVPLVLIVSGLALTLANLMAVTNTMSGVDLTMLGLLVIVTAERWRARPAGRVESLDLWWVGLASSAATLLAAALVVRLAGAVGVSFLLDLPAMFIGLGLMTIWSFERLHNRLHTRLGAK